MPRLGIEPGPPAWQANTLPHTYKRRLVTQGSTSVSYNYHHYIYIHINIEKENKYFLLRETVPLRCIHSPELWEGQYMLSCKSSLLWDIFIQFKGYLNTFRGGNSFKIGFLPCGKRYTQDLVNLKYTVSTATLCTQLNNHFTRQTLSTLGKIFSGRHFEIFLFFPENRFWHLMQIFSNRDNSYAQGLCSVLT